MKNEKPKPKPKIENEKIKEIVFNSILNLDTSNIDFFEYGVQASIVAAIKPCGW